MVDVDDLEPEDGVDAEEGGHSASLRAELDRFMANIRAA